MRSHSSWMPFPELSGAQRERGTFGRGLHLVETASELCVYGRMFHSKHCMRQVLKTAHARVRTYFPPFRERALAALSWDPPEAPPSRCPPAAMPAAHPIAVHGAAAAAPAPEPEQPTRRAPAGAGAPARAAEAAAAAQPTRTAEREAPRHEASRVVAALVAARRREEEEGGAGSGSEAEADAALGVADFMSEDEAVGAGPAGPGTLSTGATPGARAAALARFDSDSDTEVELQPRGAGATEQPARSIGKAAGGTAPAGAQSHLDGLGGSRGGASGDVGPGVITPRGSSEESGSESKSTAPRSAEDIVLAPADGNSNDNSAEGGRELGSDEAPDRSGSEGAGASGARSSAKEEEGGAEGSLQGLQGLHGSAGEAEEASSEEEGSPDHHGPPDLDDNQVQESAGSAGDEAGSEMDVGPADEGLQGFQGMEAGAAQDPEEAGEAERQPGTAEEAECGLLAGARPHNITQLARQCIWHSITGLQVVDMLLLALCHLTSTSHAISVPCISVTDASPCSEPLRAEACAPGSCVRCMLLTARQSQGRAGAT